tara:strand:- start:551 stop:784 length:234 start_codon:yes stop_codon:yes gene_type:complete
MKAILFLFVAVTTSNYGWVKVPINNFTNCDDAFEKVATWIENPNYKPNNDQVWGFYVYKNRPIAAHYCLDLKGNYLL